MKDYFKRAGIDISEKQKKQFETYYQLLVEWNEKVNLTSIIEYEEVIQKHFIDSVMAARYISFQKLGMKCIDVGTGAGFPGLPLAILFPELQVLLLDSLNKRVRFLNHVVERLDLKNVTTLHNRAEDAGRNPEFRETFDFAVSRAVANISTLSEYCVPFLKVGGEFLSYKSIKVNEELNQYKGAIEKLGGQIARVEEFCIPDTELQRSIIVINKVKSTDMKYPRKAGKPTKQPLI